jgi:hypothetical protein
MQRISIDKVRTIAIGFPIRVSKEASEVGIWEAEEIVARGLETLPSNIQNDAIGEFLSVLGELEVN